MARFKAPAEFINENVSLLQQRQGSMYSIFLESRPTFTTYYHVNKIRSKTDLGLKMPERLNGVLSPIRYNKLMNFPLYGIEQIQLQLEEEDEGLTSDYTSEAIILPNTIHPTVDDYFIINYLEKKYMFRITKYEYDTIKSNNYYKVEFSIQSVDESFFNDIERQVVKVYYTQFDNIGTDDKVFLTAEGVLIGDKIKKLYDDISNNYLDMYYRPTKEPYNTLLFMQPSEDYNGDYDWIFDQNLVHFCNVNQLFYDHYSTDAILLYEEPRGYFHMDYANSIYDLMEHYEPQRINVINSHFDLEPTAVMDSIFMYYRDRRPKYVREYKRPVNFYNKSIKEYLPHEFLSGIEGKDISGLTDPIDVFVATWISDNTDRDTMVSLLDTLEPHHNRYTFHNFIFIPLLLFCLTSLYNTIQAAELTDPDSIVDEKANEGDHENV